MERSRRSGAAVLAVLLVLLLALTGCHGQIVAVTSPPATTDVLAPVAATAEPSRPSPPTTSATATETPLPTVTPIPTDTPSPTATFPPSPTIAPKTIWETDNILILGMDQRPGEGAWRTDTIMVAAIDYQASRVGVVSIPRDLWVEIPGYGMGRINQADFQGEYQKYPGGGPALAAKVIEDNLGIPTQHWVRLKLEALPQLVDALGGVTVTLDCPLHELTPDPNNPDAYLSFDLPAGQVFLDGETAAKFARYRYATSDFSRARRQMQLIWAIRDQALRVDAIPKIPQLWRALANTFKTDLSLLDVIRLARLGAKLDSSQVRGLVFGNKAIQQAVVGGGAQVLKVGDRAELERELSNLFSAPPLALQGREGSSGKCPPPPVIMQDTPTPTATPTVTPQATPQPTP
ncbi:MAG: LCP family protein [Anaerolineae bacterium]|nr:LCP family protein [Anaerolineae bacterium]